MDFWGSKHIFVYGFLGEQAHICVQACGILGGSGGMLPRGNFDFEPFFRRNLVESGTVFAQTKFIIYCVIKAFIKLIHI